MIAGLGVAVVVLRFAQNKLCKVQLIGREEGGPPASSLPAGVWGTDMCTGLRNIIRVTIGVTIRVTIGPTALCKLHTAGLTV